MSVNGFTKELINVWQCKIAYKYNWEGFGVPITLVLCSCESGDGIWMRDYVNLFAVFVFLVLGLVMYS